VVGDNTGADGSALLIFDAALPGGDRIADGVNVRVNSDGLLNLNGKSDTIGSLTFQGGDVQTGSGTLKVAGNLNFLSSVRESNISGFLDLQSAVRTFDVAAATSARIDATINAGGINKTGTGTLILTSNSISTYSGTTTVDGGVLNVRADNALGQGNASDPAAGTEVNTGAALQLQGGITIANERLLLGSTGVSSDGGLLSLSGNNTWGGAIVLDGTSRINTNADTLTLSGSTLNMATNALTFGGAGNTDISKVITSSSAGNLTKDGNGTLFLSGNNTYSGNTLITQGIVNISNDFALGGGAGTTTITSGAVLQTQGGITSGEVISLSGTGLSSTGAIRNMSGNNTLAGAVTMTGTTRINSDAGTLTLSGGVSGAGQALQVGGAGNTTISAAINTTTGTLTKDGSGTLTLSGVNGYTGATNVNGGTLAFGTANALGTSNLVATAGGTIVDLNGLNQSIGTISGTGTIDFGGASLTLNGSSTFAGAFDGSGTLILGSGSSLTFGVGFYNPNLNIVLNGGSLFLNDTYSTFGSLTVNSPSILDFGAGASTVQFTTGVTSNATLTVNNWVNMVDYFYSSTSAGIQGAAPLNNIVFNGFVGNDTTWLPYDSGPGPDNQITPVPEPEVYGAAFVSGLLALVVWRRRKAAAARR
jgi:fibronectin-binding autotransporter adhesin